jgi:hypothetical protein
VHASAEDRAQAGRDGPAGVRRAPLVFVIVQDGRPPATAANVNITSTGVTSNAVARVRAAERPWRMRASARNERARHVRERERGGWSSKAASRASQARRPVGQGTRGDKSDERKMSGALSRRSELPKTSRDRHAVGLSASRFGSGRTVTFLGHRRSALTSYPETEIPSKPRLKMGYSEGCSGPSHFRP